MTHWTILVLWLKLPVDQNNRWFLPLFLTVHFHAYNEFCKPMWYCYIFMYPCLWWFLPFYQKYRQSRSLNNGAKCMMKCLTWKKCLQNFFCFIGLQNYIFYLLEYIQLWATHWNFIIMRKLQVSEVIWLKHSMDQFDPTNNILFYVATI